MPNEGERALRHAVRPRVVLRYLGELSILLGVTARVPTLGAAFFAEFRLMLPDATLVLTGNAQTNFIASLSARSAGFTRVITRIDDEEFEHVTNELGLVDTIIPARTIGKYLADVVEGHDVLELSGAIKGDARVFLFAVREEDEGTVAELKLPDGARVSHLYREGALILGDADLHLRKGDEVVIVTHRKHLEDLRSRWVPKAGGRRH